METYTTEEQQIEQIKKWWAENGIAIGLGIVIGLGGIFGWRGWQAQQNTQAEAASAVYETMIIDLRQGETEQAKEKGLNLTTEYTSTTYAVYAAMALAKIAIDDNDFTNAKTQLEFASKKAKTKELKLLAELRLARVLLAEGNADEALAKLDKNDFSGFQSTTAELKGDIYVEKADMNAAAIEYASALAHASNGTERYSILEMKLDSVGRSSN